MKAKQREKAVQSARETLGEATWNEFRFRMSRNFVLPEWVYRKGYRATTVPTSPKGDE